MSRLMAGLAVVLLAGTEPRAMRYLDGQGQVVRRVLSD